MKGSVHVVFSSSRTHVRYLYEKLDWKKHRYISRNVALLISERVIGLATAKITRRKPELRVRISGRHFRHHR